METYLSEAELFIMEQFWQAGAMGTAQLGEMLKPREWKPTTILTFLSRLVGKEMLAVEKQGKANRYSPLVSREEYNSKEGRIFLDSRYGGSATAFLAFMVNTRGISAQELKELRRWLDETEAE